MNNETVTTPSDSTAVFLKDVSVAYSVPTERIRTIKEYLIKKARGKIKHKQFLALNNVNLNVQQGEIYGIIGRNGAGKSTLLKVISRVLLAGDTRLGVFGQCLPLHSGAGGVSPSAVGPNGATDPGLVGGFQGGSGRCVTDASPSRSATGRFCGG